MINDNIPKSQTESYKQIELLLNKFKEESNKTNNTMTLDSMISIIDNKYAYLINNIKTPIKKYINEHVIKNLDELKKYDIKKVYYRLLNLINKKK